MPNYVQNRWILTGPKEVLERVKAEVMRTYTSHDGTEHCTLDFAKIVPYPEGFDPDLPGGIDDNAYEVVYRMPAAEHLLSYSWAKEAGVTNLDELAALLSKRYAENAEKALANMKEQPDNEYLARCAELYQRYPTYEALAEAYKRNIELAGAKNWYAFNTKNWGTKWNALDGTLEEDEDYLDLNFETAWSFPEPIFHELLAKYPELVITGEVDEEGGFFYLDIRDNELIWHKGARKGGPYDYDDEEEESESAEVAE